MREEKFSVTKRVDISHYDGNDRIVFPDQIIALCEIKNGRKIADNEIYRNHDQFIEIMTKIEKLKKLISSISFFGAFQKREDDMYIVLPFGPFRKAYLLNQEQFQVFENWFIDTQFGIRKLSQVRIVAASFVGLVVLSDFVAVSLGYISLGLALALTVPFLLPAFWFLFKEVRMDQQRRMETFPFSKAPVTQYRFVTFLKRNVINIATMRIIKWLAWMLLAVGSIKIQFLIFTLVIVIIAELEPEDISSIWISVVEILTISIIELSIPLAIIIFRRNFKKRTGQSLSLKALYLDELGREPKFLES